MAFFNGLLDEKRTAVRSLPKHGKTAADAPLASAVRLGLANAADDRMHAEPATWAAASGQAHLLEYVGVLAGRWRAPATASNRGHRSSADA